MITFQKQVLTDIVLFRKAELDLGYQGLTVIRGHNKNAKAGLHRANGAGKSLLASMIANPYFGVSPSITEAKTRARKDAFIHKAARIDHSLMLGERQVEISKYLKGSSFRYDISVDGEKKFDSSNPGTAAEVWIRANFPLSEQQFYSTVYLDIHRSHPLVGGTSAGRMEYFTELFPSLETYDRVKSHFADMRTGLARNRGKLEALESNLERLQSEMTAAQGVLAGVAPADVEAIASALEHGRERAYSLAQAATLWADIPDDLVAYDPKVQQRLSKGLETAKAQWSAHQLWMDWREEVKDASSELTSAQRALVRSRKALLKTGEKASRNVTEVVNRQRDVADAYRKLEERREDHEEAETELLAIQRKVEAFGDKPEESDATLRAKLAKVQAESATIEDQLERLGDLTQKNCPTCGSAINQRHRKVEEKRLRDQRSALLAKHKTLDAQLDKRTEYEDLQARYLKWKPLYNDNAAKDAVRQRKLGKAKSALADYARCLHARSNIDVPAKPKSAIRLDNPDDVKAVIAALKTELEALQDAQEAHSLLRQASKLGFPTRRSLRKAQAEASKTDLNGLQARLVTLQAAQDAVKRLQPQIEAGQAEVTTIAKVVSRGALIDAMVDLYGNKGLKRQHVANLAAQVELGLNNMSHHIFDEATEFRMVVSDNNFEVEYKRKRTAWTDVRNLSGAERRCFIVLSMLGLLPLLPASLRSNLLVLDEMDANLDPQLRSLYINELVPALNSVIPHVVIVTPGSDPYPSAREILVRKTGNRSVARQL